MIATTIIISTRVKPPRRLLSLFNIANFLFSIVVCLIALRSTRLGMPVLRSSRDAKRGGVLEFLEIACPRLCPDSDGLILAARKQPERCFEQILIL
jgi:hypothetical protein